MCFDGPALPTAWQNKLKVRNWVFTYF